MGWLKIKKNWISWERNIIFLRNKKNLNLSFRWQILRSYRFVAEVTFNASDLLHIFIFYHNLRNALKLHKMSKTSSLKETGPNYYQKFVCSDNLGENIWHKVKKYSKIGQDFKNLLSCFACFLSEFSSCQSLISGRKTWH